MRNEKYVRGPAVSDGLEAPSDRASLVIVLKNATTGEQAIWGREDSCAGPGDNYINVSNAWLTTFLGWGVGGYPTA